MLSLRRSTGRTDGSWSTRARVLVAAGAALLVAGVGGFAWLRDDRTDPVSVDEVVERYQAQAGTGDRTATVAVPPGVYVYATEGTEGVDALGGSDHTYPAETAITVGMDGDGCVRTRWDALDQRYDEHVTCPADGGAWTRRSTSVHHSFFRQSETRGYACEPGALDLPAEPAAGATFTARCASDGSGHSGESGEEIAGTVVGLEDVRVEGTDRPALHVRYETTVTGETSGSSTLDRWLSLDRLPLVLREVKDERTTSETVIGTVEYHESYELTLARWDPRG
jgi:hypothetical protein